MSAADEIRRTIVRYGQYIDDRNLEGWVSLYTRDGVHEINGRAHHGSEELRAFMSKAFERIGDLRHLVLGSSIEVDGDQARATSDWMTVRKNPDGTVSIASVGRFDDVLRVEDGQWRFAHRVGTRWAGAPPKQPEDR